ncbi:hypothetical protein LYZ37_22180 [Vibrio tubiashii]|uniref:hypothetical protein n=1 Tax=Vibrio tubiashii TaxID=29498 RepID=UPI00234E445D|nr:hypothetical protein [Vibrio tubiashii]WCP69233.1 hypothetical protein LYZ37_22180 [Vibrio tubiashii]
MNMIRKLAPRSLVCGIRTAWILLSKRGQVQRDEDGNCVDADGNHLPWMTYPAIDYLNSLDLSHANVFEFGSGASTLFWKKRCNSVCAIEHYIPWFERMDKYNNDKVNIIKQPDGGLYPNEIESFGLFDVISIDGAERSRCAKHAVNHLKSGGLLILDNSEWYPETATFLRDNGFTQLDFCGFAPLNSFTSMTSIFFKNEIKFPYLNKKHGWIPIGGKALDSIPADDLN